MRWQSLFAIASVAVSSTLAISIDDVSDLYGRVSSPTEQLRREVNIGHMGRLHRRQSSTTASAPQISTTPASGDASKFNNTAWDAQTAAACNKSLAALNGKAEDPSGMAVCYNLPFLDNSTGVFQADLRLYRISPPTAEWTGVSDQAVKVGISYAGASVSSSMANLSKRAALALSWMPSRIMGKRQAPAAPQMLETFKYVGQIEKDLMSAALNS
jgi:hypothetical protein